MRRFLPTYLLTASASLLALAVAFFLMSVAANAGEKRSGFYASAGAGWSHTGDIEIGETDTDLHDQWYAGASIGHRWRVSRTGYLSAEIWGRYARNGIAENAEFEPFGAAATVGNVTVMPCALYEYDSVLTVDPFVGGCFGLGYVGFDPKGRDAFPNAEADNFNSADLYAAAAVRGGLCANLTDGGGWRVCAEYAYTVNALGSPTGAEGDHADQINNHTAGLRFEIPLGG